MTKQTQHVDRPRQVGEVSVSEIEALVKRGSDVLRAGFERLEDIGEASPTYLAKEAFVAMVAVAIRQGALVLVRHSDEAQSSQQNGEGL